MRNSLVLILAACLLNSFLPSCFGQGTQYVLEPVPETGSFNIVDHGEFSSDDIGFWTQQGTDQGQFVLGVDSGFGQAPLTSAKSETATDGTGTGYALTQDIALTANTDYVIGAFFRAEGVSTGNLRVELDGVLNSNIESLLPVAGWHFVYRVFNSGANDSAVIQIVRDAERSTDDCGFVDKVSLTPLSDFTPPTACTAIIADSVQDFSDTQGQEGWFYGYYDGPFTPSDFQLMTVFESDIWYVDNTNDGEYYWTRVFAKGSHPNGLQTSGGRTSQDQWPVRRYVFDAPGIFDIIIKINDTDQGNGNGINARIFRDDQEIFARYLENSAYSTSLTIQALVGTTLDFVVDPRNSNDWGDSTDFEVIIAEEAAPAELVGINLFRGNLVSGGAPEVKNSDDTYMRLNPGFTLSSAENPVSIFFEGYAAGASKIVVESQAGTPGLEYITEAWNWNTSEYESVGTRGERFNTDQTVIFTMTENHVGRFGRVRSRVGWRKIGFTLNFPWEVRIDQLTWN